VANGRDTPLLDAAQLVAAEAPCAIPGDELLYDHVHFLPEGHYLVASGLCARIVHSGIGISGIGQPHAAAALGFEACMARMGFTARDYQHAAREMLTFFDQEPFIDQLNHGQTMASAAERLIDATHAVEVHSAGYYVTQYMHAVELDPERADLRARLAQAMHDAGDVGGCIRELETALRLNPALIDETCALAEIYRIVGRYDDALRVLDRALAVDRSHAELYHQRGHVHFARGDLEAALQDYEASVRLHPRGVPGYVACGDALRFMGRHAEAIEVYTRGLAYDPDAVDLLRRRAQCYAARGQLDAALSDLERVVTYDPTCAAAWDDAAGIYMLMGSNQAAFAAYTRAIEHDDRCTNAFVQRGRLWVDVEEFGRAARDFSRAIDLDHERGEVYAYRAFARFRAGDYRAALADIRTAMQKGYTVKPQFAQAVQAALRAHSPGMTSDQ
jgi:tetratricopeptide (TPR) repeat protein